MMEKVYFDFEQLKVYQKALGFVNAVFSVVEKMPREYVFSVGNNFVRAALSITNNIVEGNDKASVKERKRFFQYASDSARECVSVLIVLSHQKFVHDELFWGLKSDLREITSMLRALKN